MAAEAEAQTRGRFVICLAAAAPAFLLFRQLALEWRINPQYSYGWVVPLLAAYLFWERWNDRPTPDPTVRKSALFFILLLIWLPMRLIQEANPDWRLVSWMAALIVVGFLWLALLFVGGRSWWGHFAFATAFILIATPWPTPLENFFVQRLMQSIADGAAEFLNWLGIAAQQQGNLIQLTGGSLGVDEACSGVRSFQATLMVSLFLGELFRLSVFKRLFLMIAGAMIAVAFNFARALTLAIAAGRLGTTSVERWHDPAGYIVLLLTFITLLAIAKALRTPRLKAGVEPSTMPLHFPKRAAIVTLVWLGLCEVANAAWYRSHESNTQPKQQWVVDWPYPSSKISENVRLLLRFNEGESAIWNGPQGSQWQLFFFHWKPGRAAANLARNHRPETCLPATGFKLAENRGTKVYSVNELNLPIHRLEFTDSGQRLHVYYCLWEDRTSPNAEGPSLLTRENRLRAVIEGRRHLGQRVLEVVIAGIDSPEKADEEFAAELPKWIRIER